MGVHTLPARFVRDWLDIGLAPEIEDEPVIVKQSDRYLTVDMSDARLGDLLSRAEVYAVFEGGDFADNRGLVLSARSLLDRFSSEQQAEARAAFRTACRP